MALPMIGTLFVGRGSASFVYLYPINKIKEESLPRFEVLFTPFLSRSDKLHRFSDLVAFNGPKWELGFLLALV